MADEQIAASSTASSEVPGYQGMTDEQIESLLKAEPSNPDSAPGPNETTGEQTDSPTERQDKGKTEARFQDLLKDRAELRRHNQELSERLARLEGRLDERNGKPSTPKPEEAPARPTKPKMDDYETYAEYEEAKDAYNEAVRAFDIQAALAEERKRYTGEQEKRAQQSEQQEKLAGFQERVKAVSSQYPDFAEVVMNPDVKINDLMREFIIGSEYGPHVAYALGKDDGALAARVSSLSPIAMVRELTKIEATFDTPDPGTPKPGPVPVKKVSSASPPPGEVRAMNAAPEDEAMAALQAGDTARYMKIMNARDLAAMRGR